MRPEYKRRLLTSSRSCIYSYLICLSQTSVFTWNKLVLLVCANSCGINDAPFNKATADLSLSSKEPTFFCYSVFSFLIRKAARRVEFAIKHLKILDKPSMKRNYDCEVGYTNVATASVVCSASLRRPGRISWPGLSTDSEKNFHFLYLSMTSASYGDRKTLCTRLVRSSGDFKKTMMSSR